MAARLLIALVLVGLVVMAVTSVLSAFAPAERAATRAMTRGPEMPASFQKIAYVLLIVLMFMVVSGAVGAF